MPALPVSESDLRVLNRANRIIQQWTHKRLALRSPGQAKVLFLLSLHADTREAFEVLFLDTALGMLAHERLFQGGLSSVEVHVREVARRALELGADRIIISHNHPSGSQQPSRADVAITRRLRAALGLLDIGLEDHVLVAGGEAFSFREEGWL